MSNRRRSQKIRLIVSAAAVVVLIGAFALIMHVIEGRMAQRELSGDTGKWGSNKTTGHVLTIDDTDYVYTDRIRNYLLIGTDGSGDLEYNKGKYGDLADFLVLLTVNDTDQTYGFVQLDRDTITDVDVIDEDGVSRSTSEEQISTAHWYGRNEEERNRNTVSTVSRFFGGLAIDGYYMINMRDIGALNDAVGGVTVTVEDDLTGVDPALKKGAKVKLTGKQAEAYVRARMTVSDGTNVSRMKRQRGYMQSFYSLVMSQMREDANYLNDLYDALSGKILSDQPHSKVSEIANSLYQYESKGILLIDGETTSADTLGDGVIHTEFYPDMDSLLQTMQSLFDVVPLTDDLLENVEIEEWKEAEEEETEWEEENASSEEDDGTNDN